MNYHRANSAEEGDAKARNVLPAVQSVPVARDPYSSSVGAYIGSAPDSTPDFQINLLDYLQILVKRRWLILSVVAASLVLTVLITLMQTPLYTSTIRLQIDRQVAKIVEGGNITPIEGPDLEFMKTQYELLEGRTMAERVASALKLGDDADFFKTRGLSLVGSLKRLLGVRPPAVQADRSNRANLEAAAAGVVLGNRLVLPIPGSRLVDIVYSDPNPARAHK